MTDNYNAAPTPISPRWPRAIATVFGLGFTRPAPGTVASLVALPAAWAIVWLGGGTFNGRLLLLLASILVFATGSWACEHYSRTKGEPDPSECVIDEVAGQFFACTFAPLHLLPYLLAFVLFRVFDITKLWPVSLAENRIPGGLGIMADDVVAGLMAGIVLAVLTSIGIL
ncbi:MAG TPA: phosphatidylglycerophosphatase A [Rhizomicrobium sp.]|nr:phosphatidylglycerophosphatase A [Rhizomicrobium sp.]